LALELPEIISTTMYSAEPWMPSPSMDPPNYSMRLLQNVSSRVNLDHIVYTSTPRISVSPGTMSLTLEPRRFRSHTDIPKTADGTSNDSYWELRQISMESRFFSKPSRGTSPIKNRSGPLFATLLKISSHQKKSTTLRILNFIPQKHSNYLGNIPSGSAGYPGQLPRSGNLKSLISRSPPARIHGIPILNTG